MKSSRSFAAALLATLVVAALSGCGGSGGSSAAAPPSESTKSAAQILLDVQSAVRKAKSVHLRGQVTGTSALALDLRIGPDGGAGTVSTNGLSFQLTRIEHAAYFSGSPAFYRHFTNAAAAQLLKGRWLKVPASDSRFEAFSRLTDLHALLGSILTPKGTVAKTGARTLNGVAVVGLRDSAGHGTLYVAAAGTPYPVEIVQTGARPGLVHFDHWDAPVSLHRPADSINLEQLAKLAG
jgi:hypothetical protein